MNGETKWLAIDGGFVAARFVDQAGVIAWSLAEYWIHRLVFHGPTSFEPMHQMHHALPKDMIGVASWGTLFTAGVMLGYLFYCAIHVRFHHHGAGAQNSPATSPS
jgi:dihydroceramide fatty acyl 2-hydroxylase